MILKQLTLKLFLIGSIVFCPALALAFNVTENQTCNFTTPVNLGSSLAPDYEYQESNCSTTYAWPDQASTSNLVYTIPYNNFTATTGTSSAVIDTTWTFGELFIAFLLVFFIGYTIIKDVLRFFFPDRVKIERIN
jgi:hypothetical protein